MENQTAVRNAERAGPRRTTPESDAGVMRWVGGGMLALAGMFLWKELKLPQELLLTLMAVVSGTLAVVGVPGRLQNLPAFLALATVAVGGVWFLATKASLLLIGLGLAALVVAWEVLRNQATGRSTSLEKWEEASLWHGLGVSILVTSTAFYFRFITMGVGQDALVRRLVLTAVWMSLGVLGVVLGQRRGRPVIRDVGFVFVAVAVGKSLLYDMAHLPGDLRIAGLALGGGLLLVGAKLNTFRAARPS